MYEQPYNPYLSNISIVKEYFKSGRVLVMGILYIATILISIGNLIYTAAHPFALYEYAMQLLRRFSPEMYEQAKSYSSEILNAISHSSNAGAITTTIISCAVTALFAAAFFIIYSKSRSNDPNATPQAGVSILYVFAVITLVITILGAVITVLALFLFYGASDMLLRDLPSTGVFPDGTTFSTSSLMTIIFISAVIISIFAIIYSLLITIGRVRCYSSVKKSLTTVELENKGAKLYGVMCMISGVFMVLSVLGNLVNVFSVMGDYKVNAILSTVASAVSAVMMIIEGSLALGYNKHIDRYKYGYDDTPYGGVKDPGYVPPMPGDPYYAQGNDGYAGYSAPLEPVPNYGDQMTDISAENAGYQDSEVRYEDVNTVPAPSAVCPNCGAPVGDHPFCSRCGTKL